MEYRDSINEVTSSTKAGQIYNLQILKMKGGGIGVKDLSIWFSH